MSRKLNLLSERGRTMASTKELRSELKILRRELRVEVYKREPNEYWLDQLHREIREVKDQMIARGIRVRKSKYEG